MYPIPVPIKSKNPALPEWPDLLLRNREAVDQHFPDGKSLNIGILLQPPTVDVDVDAEEARRLVNATRFLPDTSWVSRRPSAPRVPLLVSVRRLEGDEVPRPLFEPRRQARLPGRDPRGQATHPGAAEHPPRRRGDHLALATGRTTSRSPPRRSENRRRAAGRLRSAGPLYCRNSGFSLEKETRG